MLRLLLLATYLIPEDNRLLWIYDFCVLANITISTDNT